MSDVIVTDGDEGEGAADVAQVAAVAESAGAAAVAAGSAGDAAVAADQAKLDSDFSGQAAAQAAQHVLDAERAANDAAMTRVEIQSMMDGLGARISELATAFQSAQPQPLPIPDVAPSTEEVGDEEPAKPHFLQRRWGRKGKS